MPLAAEQIAKGLRAAIGDLYSYQFALVPDDSWLLDGFVSRPFGDQRLTHCPKLEVTTIYDRGGNDIGYCLGIAVDRVGVRLDNTRTLDAEKGAANFWDTIETFALELAGRWLLLVRNGVQARIYGDASGMYNCVYDPVKGGVGSTLLLSLMREIKESKEVDYRETLSHGLRMPFGRTRDAHAKRLSVNHYLDLNHWTEARFWPAPGDFKEVDSGGEEEVIASLRDRLAAVFAGIVTSTPTSIGVSGGFDSRNLVAAGKDTLGHVKSFFALTHNFNSRTDFACASSMMKALGFSVDRHMKDPVPYTESELNDRNARFGASTGYAIGLHAWTNIKYRSGPEPGHIVFTGNVMEALRAAHWKSESANRPNPFKFGLKRCLFTKKFDEEFVAHWLPVYKDWVAALPNDAKKRYIDVLFSEHNLPNLGTLFFSHQNNFWMCPFNDRKLIRLSASLPVAYRFSEKANMSLLALAAPELLDVPFVRDVRRTRWEAAQSATTSDA